MITMKRSTAKALTNTLNKSRSISKRSSKSKKSRKKLSTLPYHHHYLPREEVDCLLSKMGDFLLRETVLPEGNASVIVSVKSNETVKHYPVEYSIEERLFRFVETVAEPNIIDLIEHHYHERVPIFECYLITPIPLRDWEILNEKLIFEDIKLGEGNFAKVSKGLYKSTLIVAPDGTAATEVWIDIAYKRLRLDCLKSKTERDKMKFQLLREFHAGRHAGHHRCLLALYGIYIGSENLALVMEYCDGGSLDAYLRRNKGNNDTYAKLSFLRHAAEGLAHMHERQLIHRDVAARNFLLVNRERDGLLPLIKLADYGLTRLGPIYRMQSDQEVPYAIYPMESLKEDAHWSYKSDVWSYGVLVYQVFDECQTDLYSNAGSPCFNSATLLEVLESGYRLPATADMPEECRAIMRDCFNVDPNVRPDMIDIKTRLEVPLKTAWHDVNS